MLPENEYSEIESRYYLNPQAGIEESNKFIENLRSAQQQNTAQIAKDTAALGTEVSSNLGGLIGGEGYFTSRYQTPQTNSLVANLRAASQAAALNQALANEQALWKNRYQNAYRNYQRRQNARATAASQNPSTTVKGVYETEDNSNDTLLAEDAGGYVTNEGLAEGVSRTAYGMDGYIYTQDTLPNGRVMISNTDDPAYVKADDGYFYRVPTSDSFGPFSWGLSDEARKTRANNAAQLEKIRFYKKQQEEAR